MMPMVEAVSEEAGAMAPFSGTQLNWSHPSWAAAATMNSVGRWLATTESASSDVVVVAIYSPCSELGAGLPGLVEQLLDPEGIPAAPPLAVLGVGLKGLSLQNLGVVLGCLAPPVVSTLSA